MEKVIGKLRAIAELFECDLQDEAGQLVDALLDDLEHSSAGSTVSEDEIKRRATEVYAQCMAVNRQAYLSSEAIRSECVAIIARAIDTGAREKAS